MAQGTLLGCAGPKSVARHASNSPSTSGGRTDETAGARLFRTLGRSSASRRSRCGCLAAAQAAMLGPHERRACLLVGAPFRTRAAPWALRRRPPFVGEHNTEVRRELAGAATTTPGNAGPPTSTPHDGSTAPLAGVRVHALTHAWIGTFCTELLAFFGAEVIQVETHRRLDTFRSRYALPGAAQPWNCAPFNALNLNKLGITPGPLDARRRPAVPTTRAEERRGGRELFAPGHAATRHRLRRSASAETGPDHVQPQRVRGNWAVAGPVGDGPDGRTDFGRVFSARV